MNDQPYKSTQIELTNNPHDKHPFRKKQPKALAPTDFTDAEAEAFNHYLLRQKRKKTPYDQTIKAIEKYIEEHTKK